MVGRRWDGQKLPGGGTCVQGASITREMCHVTSGKCCCPQGTLERRGFEPWLGPPPPPTPKPQTCLRTGICMSREPTSPWRQHLLTRASRTAWLRLPKKDPEGGHTPTVPEQAPGSRTALQSPCPAPRRLCCDPHRPFCPHAGDLRSRKLLSGKGTNPRKKQRAQHLPWPPQQSQPAHFSLF